MKGLCPRCEDKGYVVKKGVSDREYYYFIHKSKGKVVRQCYLGPVGDYVLVEYMSNLGLTNMLRDDRFMEYAKRAIMNHYAKAMKEYAGGDVDMLLRTLREFMELRRAIEGCIEDMTLSLMEVAKGAYASGT